MVLLFAFLLFIPAFVVAEDGQRSNLAIGVLINNGTDSSTFRCSEQEHQRIESVLEKSVSSIIDGDSERSVAAQTDNRERRLSNVNCNRICANFPPGSCFVLSGYCLGYRRNLSVGKRYKSSAKPSRRTPWQHLNSNMKKGGFTVFNTVGMPRNVRLQHCEDAKAAVLEILESGLQKNEKLSMKCRRLLHREASLICINLPERS